MQASYKLGSRGPSSVAGAPWRFKEVTGTVRVVTNEPDDRLELAQEMTDSRCPMYNLMAAAGVDIRLDWGRARPAARLPDVDAVQ